MSFDARLKIHPFALKSGSLRFLMHSGSSARVTSLDLFSAAHFNVLSMLSHFGHRVSAYVRGNDNWFQYAPCVAYSNLAITISPKFLFRRTLQTCERADSGDYNICRRAIRKHFRQASQQHFNPPYDVPPTRITFLLKTNERTFVQVTLISSRKGIHHGRD